MYFLPPVFFTFSPQNTHFPQILSLFPHMTLGYVMKCSTEFRVLPPSVLGWVTVFVRAVVTEMGEKTGESGEKVILSGKVKKCWEMKCIIIPRYLDLSGFEKDILNHLDVF